MGNVSKSMYRDLRKARQSQKDESKPFVITRLTKAGSPSKLPEDTNRFATLEEMKVYMENFVWLNPGVKTRWQFTYDSSDQEQAVAWETLLAAVQELVDRK